MSLRYLKDVVTLELDPEKCIGCGMCAEVCVHGVFTVGDRVAHVIDRDACMECGACARNCPADAVSVRSGVGCAYAVWKSWFRRKKEGGGVSPACS
jgi:ferredoxin